MSTQDTPRLLTLLVSAGVRFVVIGGVAAIAHGASTFTRNLDVLIKFDTDTITRLLEALRDLDPRAALDPAHRPIPGQVAGFDGFRNLYVTTKLGRLDLLGETPLGGYEELSTRATSMVLAGVSVQVVSIDRGGCPKERTKDEARMI